jgi:hypothetical protein
VISVSRSRFFRGFLASLLIGAALLLGGLGVSLLVEAATGHGSSEGNLIRIAVGLMLLVSSPVFFIVGIINWRLSQPSSEDANN